MKYTFNYFDNVINETKSNISKWIYSEELKSLLECFNFDFKKSGNLKEDAEKLLNFSSIWDYRKKQSQTFDNKTKESARWLIKSDNLSNKQVEVINNVISTLGLIDVYNPLKKEYDYIFALGGARLSCLERPKYVSYLIDKYKLNPKAVIMLSCMRPISDSEREFTDTYAKDANNEFELINEGAKIAFNLTDNFTEDIHLDENPNKSYAIKKYNSNYPFEIISIAGPSSEPEKRRANSADTYRFFLDRFNIGSNKKILLVTSQIYVPYQQLEAIRTWAIPTNNNIETIGFYFKNADKKLSKSENYLQEIRSTIESINRFLDIY